MTKRHPLITWKQAGNILFCLGIISWVIFIIWAFFALCVAAKPLLAICALIGGGLITWVSLHILGEMEEAPNRPRREIAQ